MAKLRHKLYNGMEYFYFVIIDMKFSITLPNFLCKLNTIIFSFIILFAYELVKGSFFEKLLQFLLKLVRFFQFYENDYCVCSEFACGAQLICLRGEKNMQKCSLK